MKASLLGLFIFLFCASLIKGENLFDNSDMENSGAWKGDRKFEELDGNRVISIKSEKNKKLGFFQNAKTRGMKEVVLKFRYQTKDYKGNGMDIRAINRSVGGNYYTIHPKADGQWHEVKLSFFELSKMPEVSFVISLNRGEGTVYFDDITLEEAKK